MTKDQLLKEVATTGYNVLYAAKKHFATYDIVEKAPGWITLATLAVGIFGLVIPALTNTVLSAAILMVGVAAIYFNQFQDQRQKYADTGGSLTSTFNALRAIYYDVAARAPGDDLSDAQERYQKALSEAEKVWLHKHIFLSDWYAHYKIFWQAQIEWLDEQLHFRLFRDKIPPTAMVAAVVLIAAVLTWALHAHGWKVCA